MDQGFGVLKKLLNNRKSTNNHIKPQDGEIFFELSKKKVI